MTLNSLMVVMLRYSAEFGNFRGRQLQYIKVVEDRPIPLRSKCSPKNLVFGDIWFMAIFLEVS